MKDADPRMRIQAIRASETLYKAGDRSFAADYRALAKDADADVVIQAHADDRTLLKVPDRQGDRRSGAGREHRRAACRSSARRSSIPRRERRARRRRRPRRSAAVHGRGSRRCIDRGDSDLQGAVLHVPRRRTAAARRRPGGPAGTTMAPSLAGSPRVHGHRDYVIKTLLHGMTGPLDGQDLPAGVMMPMGVNDDRVDRGYRARTCATASATARSFVTAADVARCVRRPPRARRCGRPEELEASVPRLMVAQPTWKVTASHNAQAAGGR